MARLQLTFPAVAIGLVLGLGILPGCAAEEEEDVESSDSALSNEWGEIDEDATAISFAEKGEALADDIENGDEDLDELTETDGPLDGDDEDIGLFQTKTLAAPAAAVAPPRTRPAGCNPATSLDLVVYTE